MNVLEVLERISAQRNVQGILRDVSTELRVKSLDEDLPGNRRNGLSSAARLIADLAADISAEITDLETQEVAK
jgi:hypothetical protein